MWYCFYHHAFVHYVSADYCYDNDCSGHGQCRDAYDSSGNSLSAHECVCDDGFHGDYCQYQFCTDWDVCFNGGVCA